MLILQVTLHIDRSSPIKYGARFGNRSVMTEFMFIVDLHFTAKIIYRSVLAINHPLIVTRRLTRRADWFDILHFVRSLIHWWRRGSLRRSACRCTHRHVIWIGLKQITILGIYYCSWHDSLCIKWVKTFWSYNKHAHFPGGFPYCIKACLHSPNPFRCVDIS